jgi:hypothetical protein
LDCKGRVGERQRGGGSVRQCERQKDGKKSGIDGGKQDKKTERKEGRRTVMKRQKWQDYREK